MKYYTTNYLKQFHCIADRCRHSCCIGWEIDIDEDTYEYYRTLDGPIGDKLKACIDTTDTPHFVLTGREERCPFLCENGLCELILTLGEDSLCGICTEHPRFRNYIGNTEELGIGMCCEEACRMILSQTEDFEIILTDDDGDDYDDNDNDRETEEFLKTRRAVFDILSNRTEPLEARLDAMLELCGHNGGTKDFDIVKWREFLLSLERLDDGWSDMLSMLDRRREIPKECEAMLERAAIYFVYRHLAASLDDLRLSERAAFCALSTFILGQLLAAHKEKHREATLADAVEYARMYSSEIEYSEDNTEAILTELMHY